MDEQNTDAEVLQEQPAEEMQSEQQLEESTSEQHLDNNEAEEEQQQVASEDEAPLSPRQQKRVDQIEEKAKELKFNKILDRIENSRRQAEQPSRQELLDYKEALDAPDDIYEQLERDRQAASSEGYNQGLAKAQAIEWKTNIRLDMPLVKEKLDKLDPVDAEAIDKEYLYYSGFDAKTGTVRNPDISYAEFVEARVEQAERLAQRLAVNSQKNIAQQASKTGVRPTGGTAQRTINVTSADDIAKMSPEEWDKNRDAILKQIGISKYNSPYN